MKSTEINILSVSFSDSGGGAANAAVRIQEGVNGLHTGIHSRMLVKEKQTVSDDILPLSAFLPDNGVYRVMDWVALKVKNKMQHARWRPYPQSRAYFLSDLRGTYLGGALQKLDYQVLHLHWINNRFVKIEDLPTDKPIVWTLHDSWPFCGVCHYFFDCTRYQNQCGNCSMLESDNSNDLSHLIWANKKTIFESLDLHIVCPSRWLADCASKSSLLQGCNIHVIPNCLNTEEFRPLLQSEIETNISSFQIQNEVVGRLLHQLIEEKQHGKPIILFGAVNATKDKIKGYSYLLSALQVLDKQGFEANLMVFGADAASLPMNFEHISVSFLGYVSDKNMLITLYNLADVMVVPSLTEVFGQTASESMSCGTPVVAFRCTGIQDVVSKEGGYLAEPFSVEDLAAGIRSCIAHSEAWGASARQWVMEHYSLEIVGKQYCQLYNQIASSHHGICMEDQ